jgi:hypothetical protein
MRSCSVGTNHIYRDIRKIVRLHVDRRYSSFVSLSLSLFLSHADADAPHRVKSARCDAYRDPGCYNIYDFPKGFSNIRILNVISSSSVLRSGKDHRYLLQRTNKATTDCINCVLNRVANEDFG